MAPDIRKGDLVVVCRSTSATRTAATPSWSRASRGARRALGRRGRYAGVFRVIGLHGEYVIALDGDQVYRCTKRPDVSDGVTRSDGCVFPDESSYAAARTIPSGRCASTTSPSS